MDFGSRLKEFREREKKMSQSDMAQLIGIKVETYRTYEQGIREPKLVILSQIVSLGADLQYLITGTPRPFIPLTDPPPGEPPPLISESFLATRRPFHSADPTEVYTELKLAKRDNEHFRVLLSEKNSLLESMQEQILTLKELNDAQKRIIGLMEGKQPGVVGAGTASRRLSPV